MRGLLVTLLVIAAGCGDEVRLPSVEADSAHFRYFASSSDRIPSGILDRLERHRVGASLIPEPVQGKSPARLSARH
jgi:hypothetical protein